MNAAQEIVRSDLGFDPSFAPRGSNSRGCGPETARSEGFCAAPSSGRNKTMRNRSRPAMRNRVIIINFETAQNNHSRPNRGAVNREI